MKAFLKLKRTVYDTLLAHLFPPECDREEAAFLFTRRVSVDQGEIFEVVDGIMLHSTAFAEQTSGFIQLTDTARSSVIKKAHDLGASLVEIHSHLGPWPAGFSYSDHAGLSETVQHMWWRMHGRPYMALVFTESNFDALLWIDDPRVPRRLDGMYVGKRMLRPTNNSLRNERWST